MAAHDLEMLVGGLRLTLADSADSPAFDMFFAGYDRAFVLPDEKEDRDGLAACLALNHGADHAALTARYGPFHEYCLIARDAGTGLDIGGANFIAMPAPWGAQGHTSVTANLNYIYIAPEARGQGRMRPLMAALREVIGGLFPVAGTAPHDTLLFIEQNDPFRMSREAYRRDTEFTGMDQLERLRIWARQGAKVVDFPYVQPALSEDQGADDTLVLSILGVDPATMSLPRAVLRHHLERFFGISVRKGAPLLPDAQVQLDALAAPGPDIALLDPAAALAHVDSCAMPAADSFRAFVRGD